MATLLGIAEGQDKSGRAGANQRTVALSIQDGAAIIGDRRIRLADDILVVWHRGEAGTWHGFKEPGVLRTEKAKGAPRAEVRGVVLESSSGGADVAAAVIKIPAEGIAVVTSGYRGRTDWRLRVVEQDGSISFDGSPAEFRAHFAEPETLL